MAKNKIAPAEAAINFEAGIDITSIGYKIDLLIRSNLKNWQGKEIFFNPETPMEIANSNVVEAFQANKIRNRMITDINHQLHECPIFHFRNYHNY